MARPISLDHAAVIALLSEFSQAETARRMGLSESHVQKIGRSYRGEYPGVRRPALVSPVTGCVVVAIRVPVAFERAGLAEDYRDLCRDFGMVEGERRCRRLLRDTPLVSPLQGRASDSLSAPSGLRPGAGGETP